MSIDQKRKEESERETKRNAYEKVTLWTSVGTGECDILEIVENVKERHGSVGRGLQRLCTRNLAGQDFKL